MEISDVTKAARKLLPLKTCGAVIVAAGNASRMGGIDKVMAPLQGEPMIARTVRTFQECDGVSEIVIVTREDLILPITHLVWKMPKVKAVVCGGKSRQESVSLGLNALSDKVELAAIHDGARPLVTWQVIDRVIRAANTYGAAAPAIAVKDTIKVVEGRVVKATPDRSTLFAVQTPQVFEIGLIQGALAHALEEGAVLTDDCSAVERIGFPVCLTQGSEDNLKITTPRDLTWGEAILAERMR